MSASQFTRRSILTLLLSATVATTAFGQTQTQTKPFEPQVGQPGKDVVWVPTPQALVDKMLDLAKVTANDTVYDLGSGDGRTVITAAKRGARAFGIEYNPDMVELSKKNAAEAGVQRGSRDVHEGRPVRDRLLEGDRDHDVPAARHQPEAASEDSRHAAGHPHRLEHLHDGRVGSRRHRDGHRRAARPGAPRCTGSSRPRSRAPGRWRRAASWR